MLARINKVFNPFHLAVLNVIAGTGELSLNGVVLRSVCAVRVGTGAPYVCQRVRPPIYAHHGTSFDECDVAIMYICIICIHCVYARQWHGVYAIFIY